MTGDPADRGLRPDPWHGLTGRTPARVALGRAGGSLPTAELLRFALDHAEARDAVHEPLDTPAVVAGLRALGRDVLTVGSLAQNTAAYLRFPERGRRLADADRARLAAVAGEGCDVALVVADGLSAAAVHRNAVPLVGELLPRLAGRSVGPLVVARHARVAIQDPIGHALRARCAVIVLGERPGLGTADSLGVYLVFAPGPGKTDADRNCVSNVRPAGLPLAAAAGTVAYLIDAAISRGLSGVSLKDDRTPLLTPNAVPPA